MSGVNHGYNSGSIKRVREAVKVEKKCNNYDDRSLKNLVVFYIFIIYILLFIVLKIISIKFCFLFKFIVMYVSCMSVKVGYQM